MLSTGTDINVDSDVGFDSDADFDVDAKADAGAGANSDAVLLVEVNVVAAGVLVPLFILLPEELSLTEDEYEILLMFGGPQSGEGCNLTLECS